MDSASGSHPIRTRWGGLTPPTRLHHSLSTATAIMPQNPILSRRSNFRGFEANPIPSEATTSRPSLFEALGRVINPAAPGYASANALADVFGAFVSRFASNTIFTVRLHRARLCVARH